MAENLILYFSRRGENYINGMVKNLEKGNTEYVAGFIQRAVGGDLFEIWTVREYAKDYYDCIKEAEAEQSANIRPDLAAAISDISMYDNIFICGPSWRASSRWLSIPRQICWISPGEKSWSQLPMREAVWQTVNAH